MVVIVVEVVTFTNDKYIVGNESECARVFRAKFTLKTRNISKQETVSRQHKISSNEKMAQ